MTKLGVIHYNFPNFSFDDFLRFAADTGYNYVEIDQPDVWDSEISHPLSEADLSRQSRKTEAVRRHVASFGLEISAFAARNDFIQPTAEALDFQIARMKGVASQVRLLGDATVLRSEGGWTKESVDPEKWRSLLSEAFTRCIPFLDELNVNLAIDNHGVVTNDGQLLLSLLRNLNHPRIGSNLDTMNFRWAGNSLDECRQFYKDVAPYVRHVHLKDGTGVKSEYKGAALGDGEVPLLDAIEALRGAGYDGVFAAEYEGKELEGGTGYRRCFEWMEANLGKEAVSA